MKITFDEFERDTEIIADYLSEKGLKSGESGERKRKQAETFSASWL